LIPRVSLIARISLISRVSTHSSRGVRIERSRSIAHRHGIGTDTSTTTGTGKPASHSSWSRAEVSRCKVVFGGVHGRFPGLVELLIGVPTFVSYITLREKRLGAADSLDWLPGDIRRRLGYLSFLLPFSLINLILEHEPL
jgi:hypothetical protein